MLSFSVHLLALAIKICFIKIINPIKTFFDSLFAGIFMQSMLWSEILVYEKNNALGRDNFCRYMHRFHRKNQRSSLAFA
ncbi:unnamed protein product [Blepharisma stoltei]|uniref:Uncharacterized protein n=1 Tax=Blepharisma stoltei TaxID=1481888 RepID=A0AAU9JRA1_9CILI|nr:unnamed protein product [Blepharisma stoltei]